MNSYTLTATLSNNTNRKTIWARDEQTAMMDAIWHIMDRAHKNKQSAWALGAIKLVDAEGKVISTMEAK